MMSAEAVPPGPDGTERAPAGRPVTSSPNALGNCTTLVVRRSAGALGLAVFLVILAAMGLAGAVALAAQREPIAGVPGALFVGAALPLLAIQRRMLRIEGDILVHRNLLRRKVLPLHQLAECIAPPPQDIGRLVPIWMGFITLRFARGQSSVVLSTFWQRRDDLQVICSHLAARAQENQSRGLSAQPVLELRPGTAAVSGSAVAAAIGAMGSAVFIVQGHLRGWLLLTLTLAWGFVVWNQWARGAAHIRDNHLHYRTVGVRWHSLPLEAITAADEDGTIHAGGHAIRLASGFAARGDAQLFLAALRTAARLHPATRAGPA